MRRRLVATILCGVCLAACGTPPGRVDRPSLSPISTSRETLDEVVTTFTRHLAQHPTDSAAAIQLADVLVRLARLTNRASLAFDAEAALDAVIAARPSDYLARRMRATVYLSQHRFHDAIREAERCRALRAVDPVIDGILGDAHLELGNRDAAFDAFDRMLDQRPDAPAYARAAYARELLGDLKGALALMHMADAATSAHDVEAQAWHAAQLGHLHDLARDAATARREFLRADHLFPGYPLAVTGLARLDVAAGRPAAALARLGPQLEGSPTSDDLRIAGDAYAGLGRHDEARRHHALAAALARTEQGPVVMRSVR